MPAQVPTPQVPVAHPAPVEPGELVVWVGWLALVAQVLKQKVRRGLPAEQVEQVAQPELQAPEMTEPLEVLAVQILWARQVLRLPVEPVALVELPVLVGWPGLVAPWELMVEQVGSAPKQMDLPELRARLERQELGVRALVVLRQVVVLRQEARLGQEERALPVRLAQQALEQKEPTRLELPELPELPESQEQQEQKEQQGQKALRAQVVPSASLLLPLPAKQRRSSLRYRLRPLNPDQCLCPCPSPGKARWAGSGGWVRPGRRGCAGWGGCRRW